jgi:hypothetical protein
MKSGVLLALFAILISSAYAIVDDYGYAESTYSDIRVSTLKYEPYPAQPGRYLDLWVKIENAGQQRETDIAFTIIPRYPFTLAETEQATQYVGDLNGKETALIHYKIRVDSNAVEGRNLIDYTIRTYSRPTQAASLNIFVQTSDANIAVESVSAEQIVPGSIADVTLQLTNEGDTPLTDVTVKLDLSSSNIPIAPVNSTSEKKVYVIEPHQTKPITFQLLALPDAASSTYKVPIEIKFIDGTGKNYTKSSIIGLTVGAIPDISITTTDSAIYSRGDTGNVILKFTNKGLTDIKLLNVILMESEQYDVISEDEVYLGNVDSDDYETAEFRIKARKVSDGIVPLTVYLEYRDANNKPYTETRTIDLKVVSAQQLGVDGNGPGIGTLLFAIIFIAACFFIYRRWEKKKKSSKK